MQAHYYISCTTDLVRSNNAPLINDIDKELCTDFEDFVFSALIRYIGIKDKYPTAEFRRTTEGAYVVVEGVCVYEKRLISVLDTPVEID